jgi:hypothetical protein
MTTVVGSHRSVFPHRHLRESVGSRTSIAARLPLAVAGIAIGIAGLFAAAHAGSPVAPARGPVPGEFRLAPGNEQPLGVVVPLVASGSVPGEFRLGPGNAMPPGVAGPVR